MILKKVHLVGVLCVYALHKIIRIIIARSWVNLKLKVEFENKKREGK
jgi:hypothetical protein